MDECIPKQSSCGKTDKINKDILEAFLLKG